MKTEQKHKQNHFSVRTKLLATVFIVVLGLIVTQTMSNLYSTQQHYEAMERQSLIELYDAYQNDAAQLEKAARTLAISIADRPDILQALLNENRDAMVALLKPLFYTLQGQYNLAHFYIHRNNGEVFAAIHNQEVYEGSTTQHLQTTTTALQTQQLTSGVEPGIDCLEARGVAPILEKGAFVGLVEVGLAYGQTFLEESKAYYEGDYTLWISKDIVSGEPWPQSNTMESPIPELFFYVSTYVQTLSIPEHAYREALLNGQVTTHFAVANGEKLAVLVGPLRGFEGQVIGVVEIAVSREIALESLQDHQTTTISIATVLALLSLVLMWLASEFMILRTLRHLTSVAHRQLEGDLAARVKILPHDEFGRLGHAMNRLTEQLSYSIDELELQVDMLRHAERALAHEQYLVQALLNTVPDRIYFKDRQSRFIRANKAQAERFELDDHSQMVGKTDFDFFSEEHAEQAYRDEQAIIRTGQPIVSYEEKETWPDGSITWVSSTKMPLLDEDGALIGIFGISRDITERKKSETEFMRLQQLLQNISDSMPSALIALNKTGEVLLWNPAAQALTGCTLADITEQPIWEACPNLARYRDMFEEVLQTHQIKHHHKDSTLTSNSTLIYHNVDIFPLMVGNAVSGAVIRIDDVTERVQLEEMMLQSAKMASVGGLAAGIAHELNNPLGAMIQSAQMLQLILNTQRPRTHERLEACGVDPKPLEQYMQDRGVHEYLAGIRQTGKRAAKIVSDLLNFSRKSASGFAPQNLNALVEQTLDLAAADYDLKKRYDFKNIKITREIAAEIPDIICDGQQIQQVILNLVRNATYAMAQKKAAPQNSTYTPQITIRTQYHSKSASIHKKSGEDYVRLEIEDNGLGITTEAQAHLFEPFFTTKDVGEGTGLGLWLCWAIIVERHHGRIWSEPAPGGGALFIVELPIIRT